MKARLVACKCTAGGVTLSTHMPAGVSTRGLSWLLADVVQSQGLGAGMDLKFQPMWDLLNWLVSVNAKTWRPKPSEVKPAWFCGSCAGC